MKNPNKRSPYALRYFPIWLVMGILWLLIHLPYQWQLKIGQAIGWLALQLAQRERKIAEINLLHCFPLLSQKERAHLLKESFMSMGMAVMETAFGWWGSEKRLKNLLHIEGLEHIEKALQAKKGALIFTAHFACLHMAGRLATFYHPFALMAFPPKHPVLLAIRERAIHRFYHTVVPRDRAKDLLKALKSNLAVFYTPDTDAGLKNSIFAPFFGISTATVTATARFAQLSGCAVIPAEYFFRSDKSGYTIKFYPPLEQYPTDNPYNDAVTINQWIEKFVRAHPEQYLWQYKRFKTRPPGEEKFYMIL